MNKKILLLTLLATLAAPARAYYIGSVGFPMKNGGNAVEMLYDTGSREVEASTGGPDVDMDTSRLYFQYTRGLGNGLEMFGRVMPQTGTAEFDPGAEFDIWGLGGGVRWSPQQKGRFKLGFQFSFDLNGGDDDANNDIDVKELLFVGGGSYRVNKNVDAYGGLSLLKSDITIDTRGGDADLENSDTFGIFGGFDLKPSRNFTVGVELRLINETIFGVTGRLKF